MIADPESIGPQSVWQEKPGGRFKAGNPGGGRPRGSIEFLTVFRRIVTAEKFAEVLDVVLAKALDGEPWACQEIFTRALGRPRPTDEDAQADFQRAVEFTLHLTRRQNEPSTS